MLDLNEAKLEDFFRDYGEKLKYPEDLKLIFSEASKKNLNDKLEELSFRAKYFIGLTRIIKVKNEEIEKDYYKKVEGELLSAVTAIREILKEIIDGNDFISEIFKKKFFLLTQQSLNNLNLLCSDLSYFKLFLNDLKYD